MIKAALLRLLNGIQIKYGVHDLFAFFKFILTSRVDQTKKFSSTTLGLKVVVISLPFRLDRRSQINEHLTNLEIPFEFFDAVHGKSESSRAYQLVDFSSKSKKYLSPGSIGCIASHVSVWKKLLSSSYDCFLILEDDIVLEKKFLDLNLLIDNIPVDADIVYLGSGSTKGWTNMKKVSDSLTKPFSIRKGAYSYLLFRAGATKLLNEITKVNIVCGGIDSILGILGMRNKLKVYHFMPSICRVNYKSPSNILNLSDNSKIIQENEFK